MIQKIYLTLKECFSNLFISLIVFFAILVSVISVGFFEIIGSNFNDYIKHRFAASIPPDTIKVSLKQGKAVLFFQVDDPKKKYLNDRKIRRIRRAGGIKKIYPVSLANFPVQARRFSISILGQKLDSMNHYVIDAPCLGVPYGLVYKDIKSKYYRNIWKKPDFENRVPVLIPKKLIEAYNDGFAGANNLPKIAENTIFNLKFKIRFGYSSIQRNMDFIEVDAVPVGFTDKADAMALILPSKVVAYYNKKFGKSSARKKYLYAFIQVKSHNWLLKVASRIKKMGLVVETEETISREIIYLQKYVNLVIIFLMYLIILLSVIAISFSTIIATLNRVEYYRILRILGASKVFITITILIKYIILGFIGSLLGLWLIDWLFGLAVNFINIPLLNIKLKIPEDFKFNIIFYGSIIPVLSTIPALLRLYLKGLNRD
ncbi:MAG: hypothetical protein GY754_23915 [bacterium]|nr:hypothetical protein [bacterium]